MLAFLAYKHLELASLDKLPGETTIDNKHPGLATLIKQHVKLATLANNALGLATLANKHLGYTCLYISVTSCTFEISIWDLILINSLTTPSNKH